MVDHALTESQFGRATGMPLAACGGALSASCFGSTRQRMKMSPVSPKAGPLHTTRSQISTAPSTPSLFHLDSFVSDCGYSCLDTFHLDAAESYEPTPEPCGMESLPGDALIHLLSLAADISSLYPLQMVCRRFGTFMKCEYVWMGHIVHIPCESLVHFMPQLEVWVGAWRQASKLIVPNSADLILKVSQHAPELPLGIAWRFDSELKGAGVEACNGGRSVRRIAEAEDELVALADAPLPSKIADHVSENPYLEVVLDDRSGCPDDVNDFGIGVTTRLPSKAEVGAAADDIASSWVVDFTKHHVMLSVNNREAAKASCFCGALLKQGDRVGLLFTAGGSIEIYINGKLEEHLLPRESERVPRDVALFPVFDLYGCTLQLSRTNAKRPFEK